MPTTPGPPRRGAGASRVRFGAVPVDQAEGAILAHGIRLPKGSFKKGRVLSAEDIQTLLAQGQKDVVAARLDSDDVPEDDAALQLARAICGDNTGLNAPFTGRCNLHADCDGVALIDAERLDALNSIHEAITVATITPHDQVNDRQLVATVKIIPFAVPRPIISRALEVLAGPTPLVRVQPYLGLEAGLILSRLAGTKESVLDSTVKTVRTRLQGVKAVLREERRADHEADAIANDIQELIRRGCNLLLISGASAIVDRRDIIPEAIEKAGGVIDHFGMPVDPGNLLLLGHIDNAGKTIPVIGLPGCARSPKLNGFDWVLARLAAGIPVSPKDIMRMGGGGLLKEIPSRPQPRQGSAPDRDGRPKAIPRIAVLMMAAGQSRRMGSVNKLMADVDGAPMVRRAAESALSAKVDRMVVVTGHEQERIRHALTGLDVSFVHNPDFADGLSGSLRRGIQAVASLSPAVDGCLVCLGDMPQVTSHNLDRLIAAFDPLEGRAICVPTHNGKRGNPVLWGATFFDEMANVAGDVGARHLIGEHSEQVCEIAISDPGVLLDIDTPEALTSYRQARMA